jgi:putative DNA primase/helicase
MCSFLAFWTDCDPEAIDRIFRETGLYREKWEREDYRSETIRKACNNCEETVSEYCQRQRKEEIRRYEQSLFSKWACNT